MLVLILPTPEEWKAEWALAGKKVTQVTQNIQPSTREPQDWEAEILTTAQNPTPTPSFSIKERERERETEEREREREREREADRQIDRDRQRETDDDCSVYLSNCYFMVEIIPILPILISMFLNRPLQQSTRL